MSRTDRLCIKSCLDGQPEAFQVLVKRYQAPLLSYLRTRLGDGARAEEAAQETFVRSYFRLRTLKRPESFSSWLFGIGDRVAKEQQGTAGPKRRIANPLVLRCFPVRMSGRRKGMS